GRGGMGVVYQARQRGLNRIVAIKVMRWGRVDSERERFRREAEAAARLDHPNIVQIYEVASSRGSPFLAMEWIDGEGLDERLVAGPLSAVSSATILQTLAMAAHYAHERGVVHRDLKPANILLQLDDQPKIADFGLAKQISVEQESNRHELTQSGAVLGTPSYMAPEQADPGRGRIGPSTDVYALGAVLYETVTGRTPFRAETILGTLDLVRSHEPVAPRQLQPSLPRDLETICLKCLEKEPGRRYHTAGDLADDLRRFLAGEPIVARPVGPTERLLKWAKRQPLTAALLATIAVMTSLGFGVIAWQWQRSETRRVAAERAREQTEIARVAETRQRERLETNNYFQQIALAQRERLANDPERAAQILDACQLKKRGWEWDYLNAQVESDVLTLSEPAMGAYGIEFSPDGAAFICYVGKTYFGPEPGEIKLFDATTGKLKATWASKSHRIDDVAFHAHDTVFASAGFGVRVHDSASLSVSFSLPTPAGSEIHNGVAFQPGGDLLAAGGGDGVVRVWDTVERSLVSELRGHEGPVHDVAFSPDGKWLASTGFDSATRVWDIQEKEVIHLSEELGDGRKVSFSPDGRFLAESGYVGNSGMVVVWDLRPTKVDADASDEDGLDPERLASRWFKRHCRDFEFTADSQFLILASWDGKIRVWSPTTQEDIAEYHAHAGNVRAVSVSPSTRIVATIGDDAAIKLWDRAGELPESIRPFFGMPHDLAFQPQGSLLVVPCGYSSTRPRAGEPVIWLWNVESNRLARELRGHTDLVQAVACSQDGAWLASGARNGETCIWDMTTGDLIRMIEGGGAGITALKFSRDNRRLIAADRDGRFGIWDCSALRDPETDESTLPFVGHDGAINDVAVEESTNIVATAGSDAMVRLWDLESGKRIGELDVHTAAVLTVTTSRGGQWMATTDAAGAVFLWSRNEHGRFQVAHHVIGHAHAVTGAAFTPDARRLATGDSLTIKVWDTQTGQEALSVRVSANEQHLAFSDDGRRLAHILGSGATVIDTSANPLELSRVAAGRPDARLLAWHKKIASLCETDGNLAGAAFHLERVAQHLSP
ncbi:MAG: protein kinase, partial [Pirellulaceae bacterium]|nr:protein kinase [Pirellulaceae bacterium]